MDRRLRAAVLRGPVRLLVVHNDRTPRVYGLKYARYASRPARPARDERRGARARRREQPARTIAHLLFLPSLDESLLASFRFFFFGERASNSSSDECMSESSLESFSKYCPP